MNVQKFFVVAIAAVVVLLLSSSAHVVYAQEADARLNVRREMLGLGDTDGAWKIWGWSQNGLVAYSKRDAFFMHWEFAVFNAVRDEVIFKLEYPLEDVVDIYYDEEKHSAFLNRIRGVLEQHNITERQSEMLRFPIRRGGGVYNARIEILTPHEETKTQELIGYNPESGEEEYQESIYLMYDVEGGFTYRVIVGRNNREFKTAATVTVNEFRMGNLGIGGYFLSPYENRVLIVIHEMENGVCRDPYHVRFIGSHLDVGFR